MIKKVGRYNILRELGRGGMATVFLAYDPVFDREVAIKILPDSLAHDPKFQGRFAQEAKTIASLEHYAIVPVYDFGSEGNTHFLVMRLMKGGTLRHRIAKGSMSIDEIIPILKRVGDALTKAHALGIIHRDLKPDNILFDEDDQAFLSDFGIVKLTQASNAFTQTGGIIGTAAYMSPEQAQGIELDNRSDIYALGIIVFEMLTGQAPYKADTPVALLMKHVLEPLPSLHEKNPNLPAGYKAIVDRLTAKNRDERYSSITDTVKDLEAVKTGSHSFSFPTEVTSKQAPQPALSRPPQEQRRRNLIALVGGGVLTLILGFMIYAYIDFTDWMSKQTTSATSTAVFLNISSTGTVETIAQSAANETATQSAAVFIGEQTLEAQRQEELAATAQALPTSTIEFIPTETPVFTPTPVGGGQIIAYRSDVDGDPEIFLYSFDGSIEERLTTSPNIDRSPSLSPDNQRVVFTSNRTGDFELYVLDLLTQELTQITNEAGHDWSPKWSPDGQKIAFASRRDGSLDIYMMNPDGTDVVQLTNSDLVDNFPEWAPDSSKIAFQRSITNDLRQLFYVDVASGEELEITTPDSDSLHPAWSPDGDEVAFTRRQDGIEHIYLLNLETMTITQLTEGVGDNRLPSWSPDGQAIIFSSNQAGNFDIFIMNKDGSMLMPLITSPFNDLISDWG